MTTEQILALDMRVDGNREKLQKVLSKIKPFAKYEKVPLEMIEKLIGKMCRKYNVRVQYMFITRNDDCDYYTLSVKRDDTHEWIGSVYGITLYEVFAKLAVMLYALVKKGEIPERVENES